MDFYLGKKKTAININFYYPSISQNRIHGNTHRSPHNALSVDDVKRVTSFLTNYAEEHAVSLPGRIPGYKNYDFLLLPSNETKKSIWEKYTIATTAASHHAVGLTSFKTLWTKYKPNITIAKPRSDLCWQCMKFNRAIIRNQNVSEGQKSSVIFNF